MAGSLKAEASTFSEAMNESLSEAKTEFKEDKADMAAAAKKEASPAAAPKKEGGEDKPKPKKVDLSDE